MGEETLTLKYIPLDTALLWDDNKKKHDIGALTHSFELHGFKDPPKFEPALNKGKGGIVEGNGRFIALAAMKTQGTPPPRGVVESEGAWLVPVVFGVDAGSEKAAKAYGVDHNNLVMSGADFAAFDIMKLWDNDFPAQLLELADIPMASFTPEDIDDILRLDKGAGQDTEPQVTEVEAEKYHKKWAAKPGDRWRLGEHVIACLDSLKEENIKSVVGDKVISFVFADPPYGIDIVTANVSVGGGEAYDIPFGGVKDTFHHRRGYVGGGSRHKDKTGSYYINEQNKRLGSIGGAKPFGNEKPITGSVGASNVVAVGKYYPVIGDTTTETATAAAKLLLNSYPDACHIWWGANYYTNVLPPSPCWVIWDKDNTGNFADCEMAWTNQPTAARIFEHRWNEMLKASEQGQRRIHPTQKPIELARYCFETYGGNDDIILDPFLGSGISLLAAEKLGRKVIGFELEPVYISVVLERWAKLTGLTPVLLP